MEAFQRFSDSPLTECEACHGKLKKLISQSTFHLKGTGWYVTDYASKSGGNQGKEKESASASKPASTDAKKTEKAATTPSKPAKKSSDG